MSDPQAAGAKAVDPLEQWRELRDAYMDIWAKASGEAVNSDAYAQATGTMLEALLTTSSPFREAQKKTMISALEQLNMPSRDDYVRMAERLANLELLLDDMDARLRQVFRQVSDRGAEPSGRPAAVPAPEPVAVLEPAEPEPEAIAAPPDEPELFGEPTPERARRAAKKAAARKAPAKTSKKGSK